MTAQIIEQGPRNLVVKFSDVGPDTIAVASLSPPCEELRIVKIWFDNPSGGASSLSWDATADVVAWQSNAHAETFDFSHFGGLVNNAGAGVTGDVIYAGAALGNCVVHFKKVRLTTVYN